MPREPARGDGPPKAVLFDWDNTLVDTFPVIHAALADTFRAMGRAPWSEAETRARVRLSLRDGFPKLFGDDWERARDIYYGAFEARHLEALAPLAGAEALLGALSGSGVPMGVVSNKTGRYLRAEAAHLGWAAHFQALVGAGDAPRDKPARDPADMALGRMGVGAAPDVWFVGDSGVDMHIAHAAGLTPVLVGPTGPEAPEFQAFPPARHFANAAEVLEYLSIPGTYTRL